MANSVNRQSGQLGYNTDKWCGVLAPTQLE